MKSSSTGKVATRKASDIDEIIIHCSATPACVNYNASDIDRWHKAQGFAKIGYHYVVCLTGTIDPAVPCWKWARTAWKSAKITRALAFATSASPTRTSIPPAPESSDGANFRPRREFFAPRLGGIWKFVITLLSPSASAPAPHGPAPRHRLAQTPLIHSEKQ